MLGKDRHQKTTEVEAIVGAAFAARCLGQHLMYPLLPYLCQAVVPAQGIPDADQLPCGGTTLKGTLGLLEPVAQ